MFSNTKKEGKDLITILIVDNEAVNIKIAERIIRRCLANAVVHQAKSCLEAVIQAQKTIEQDKRNYSIILMDGEMPGKNGVQTTKEIRELENKYALQDQNKSKIFSWSSSPEYKIYEGINASLVKDFTTDAFKELYLQQTKTKQSVNYLGNR